MTRLFPIVLLALLACGVAAADHERLGDQAFGREMYAEALGEYRAAVRASPEARVYAKLGAAALRAQDFREAADAYTALGGDDPSRGAEAAMGLELVAQAADRAGDPAALYAAMRGLRGLAPDRVDGRYALGLLRHATLSAPEIIELAPFAVAAAPDSRAVDSLLLRYGTALQETTACEQAVAVFHAARRRTTDPGLQETAGHGIADCGLQLGLEAQSLDQPWTAEGWFTTAIAVDSASDVGRRALIGLGEVRIAQGDILGAAIAFQAARDGGDPSDSLGVRASQKLAALGAAEGDSATSP